MVHTYELSIPILVAAVWLAEFEVSTAVMGVVVTIGYGLFGVGALPGGVLTDRFGSRRLIAACLFGMGGSFVLLGFATSIWLLALALLVWGAAASVYHPAGLSLISTGVEDRGRVFAYHGMAGNVGIALGPLTTAILLLFLDWRVVVLLLAVPAGIAALYALRADVDERAAVTATDGGSVDDASDDSDATDGDSEADPGVSSFSEFFAESRVLLASTFVVVFGIVMLSGLYYRGVLTFLPEILREFAVFAPVEVGERTLEPADYFYAGLLMVGILGQYVGGRLTDRMRPERGLALGFAALAIVGIVFLPAANAGIGPFLVIGALLGFFLFLVQPLYQATVAEHTPPSARGLSYGYTYLGVFGVGSLGGALAGAILTYQSEATLFLVLAVFAVVAAILGFALTRYDW